MYLFRMKYWAITGRKFTTGFALRRGYGAACASHAVRLTHLRHLKACPKVNSFVTWKPNATSPNNISLRHSYYYALARVLGWTIKRELLEPCDGDERDTQGYSAAFHDVVNAMWPGEGHQLPLLRPQAP